MAHAATSHTQCDMCEALATHTKMKRHRPVGGSFLGGASLLGQASGWLLTQLRLLRWLLPRLGHARLPDTQTSLCFSAAPIKCCSGPGHPGHQLHRHHQHPFPNQRHLKAQTCRVARQELLRPRPPAPSAPPTRLPTLASPENVFVAPRNPGSLSTTSTSFQARKRKLEGLYCAIVILAACLGALEQELEVCRGKPLGSRPTRPTPQNLQSTGLEQALALGSEELLVFGSLLRLAL